MVLTRRTLAVAVSIVVLVGVMVSTPVDAARGKKKCFGKGATIVATGGDEPTVGTRGPDVILGTNQNDVIDGRGGDDLICGKGGDDTIAGGGGDDKLNGGSDSGFGDTLIGGGGDDLISGGGPADFTTGVNLFDGIDYNGNRGVNVNLATGVATGYGTDTLRNVEQADGTDHDDVLIGGDETNTFWAGDGDDQIDLGAGDFQQVWPGMGDDVITAEPSPRNLIGYDDIPGLTGVTIDLAQGTATGAGTDTFTNVTDVMGSAGDDMITSNDQPNVVFDCSGNDTINFAGNSATGDTPEPFIGAAGIDIAYADVCAYAPIVPGDDSYTGGSGISMVCWCASQNGIVASLQSGTATGHGNDTLTDISGLIGGPGADTLVGGPDRDYLEGTEANDTLNGGGGDDVMIAFHMSDLTVDLGGGMATGYFAGAATLSNYTLSGIEDVWGSLDHSDILIGDNQDNRLFGMGGDDNVTGNQGADHLDGGPGTDIGDAGQGTDTCVSIETPTSCETTTARATTRTGSSTGYGYPWLRSIFRK